MLLPQLDKDSMLCSSYHPISLFGVDVKIYAKSIASCLQFLLLTLVHTDQVQGREAQDNTLKLLDRVG